MLPSVAGAPSPSGSVTRSGSSAAPKARAAAAPSPVGPALQHLGTLSWGVDPATHKPWTPASLNAALALHPSLKRDLTLVLQQAKKALPNLVPTLKQLQSEGRLSTDPARIRTEAVIKRFEDVYAWAVAARVGPAPLNAQAKQRAVSTLMHWSALYKPNGNPINERAFLPMFQAADLVMPLMNKAQQTQVRRWLRSFIGAVDRKVLPGAEAVNNWKTWSLQIRGLAASVLGDRVEIGKTKAAVDRLLAHTIRPDGSSFDFHHRDALYYHLYNSRALVELAAFAPDCVSPASRKTILRTLGFLKPYYLGQKKHLEFANSQVAFDRVRANAGDPSFIPHPWNPRAADNLLQLARGIFPELRWWTNAADKKNDAARYELSASLLWPGRP